MKITENNPKPVFRKTITITFESKDEIKALLYRMAPSPKGISFGANGSDEDLKRACEDIWNHHFDESHYNFYNTLKNLLKE